MSTALLALLLSLVSPSTALASICDDLDGAYVHAQDRESTYLGFFGTQFAPESIMNPAGEYGNQASPGSVRNTVGEFGSPVGIYSANNDVSATPPEIFKHGQIIGHLTTNSSFFDGISLTEIDMECGAFLATSPANSGGTPGLPSPPAWLDASDGTDNVVIALSWAAVADATSYNIYVADTVNGTQTLVGSNPGTSTNINGATPGVSYHFWVHSQNAAGESSTGAYDSGYVGQQSSPTVPDAPTITSLTPQDGSITVQFTANGNGGAQITSYTASCGTQSASGSASPVTVTGLTNGTSYQCTVIATNSVGNSAPSSAHSATPTAGVTQVTISPGMNDAWLNPLTPGQGLLITVFPNSGVIFGAWFTFETQVITDYSDTTIGGPGQRWFTVQGYFANNTAQMTLYNSTGGVIDSNQYLPQTVPAGTVQIIWHSCTSATMYYTIYRNGGDLVGSMPLSRIVNDNVALCQALSP